jgi:hypothetical protein
MTKFRLVFGGIVAYVLLGLYVHGIVSAALVVRYLAQTGQHYNNNLSGGITFFLTTIGGLVSALAIAELAATVPGQAPGAALGTTTPPKFVSAVVIVFMLVWLVCGVYALVVGYALHDDLVPPLTAAGKSWIGVAMAATYSYLGIRPQPQGGGNNP